MVNIRCLQTEPKVSSTLLRELLYADDCSLVAHSVQYLHFADAASLFGLTINIAKTEFLHQSPPVS